MAVLGRRKFQAAWNANNSAPVPRAVKAGDRVAQLILERIVTPEVEEVENLDETVRGAGGYGSTGTASV